MKFKEKDFFPNGNISIINVYSDLQEAYLRELKSSYLKYSNNSKSNPKKILMN